MNKKKSKLPIVLIAMLSIMALTACLFMLYVSLQVQTVNEKLPNTSEETEQQEVEYITLKQIYDNPDEYINTYRLVCGYFCTEFATNTGIAWLSDGKELSKEDAQYIIRLERDEVIDYTPKAIAVYGKIEYTDENALIIKDPEFYAYAGLDTEMIKHNALIDSDVVDTVMTALRYDDTEDVSEALTVLQATACYYEDEDLEALLIDISELAEQKTSLSQTDFEAKAEQMWNDFRTQLLDR